MIYFAEDDRNIYDLVVYALGSAGFEAFGCEDDKVFRTEMAKTRLELVLLGIMLSGTSGIQTLRCLKADHSTVDIPIITIIVRGVELERIKSLDSGIDDYVTKPFGMMEPVSRVRTVLWRSSQSVQDSIEEKILILGSISSNSSGRAVMVNGETVTLTLKEHQLLEELIAQLGFIFSRDQLLGSTWRYPFHGGTRMVDMHTCALRRKLGEAAKYIKAVRGAGYKVLSQDS